MLDPYGHPVCSNCGADLRLDEGLHVCRHCADKLPWLDETQEKLAEVEKNLGHLSLQLKDGDGQENNLL